MELTTFAGITGPLGTTNGVGVLAGMPGESTAVENR